MFDKNQFKEMFMRFAQSHAHATDDEALEFCRAMMPVHLMASQYWLVDQCMQWFRWVQAQRRGETERDGFLADDEDDRVVERALKRA